MDAGMEVSSQDEAAEALMTIGYYRLRGYCYQLYDNSVKQYQHGTRFSDVVSLYRFDMELSHLIFSFLSSIEVTLRAHLVEALLVYQDALILYDPVVFEDKEIFWKNLQTLSAEIARANDVFIKHNFLNHDGQVPLWAAVEVMSFGTLSKIIKNLKPGAGSAYTVLADHYKYRTPNGNMVKPTKKMLASWVHAVAILRNMCAHNSRIYNRAINTAPMLILTDQIHPQPRYNGLYQVLLAMKYLTPTQNEWDVFTSSLKQLMGKYSAVIDLSCMNFPADWEEHL